MAWVGPPCDVRRFDELERVQGSPHRDPPGLRWHAVHLDPPLSPGAVYRIIGVERRRRRRHAGHQLGDDAEPSGVGLRFWRRLRGREVLHSYTTFEKATRVDDDCRFDLRRGLETRLKELEYRSIHCLRIRFRPQVGQQLILVNITRLPAPFVVGLITRFEDMNWYAGDCR